MKKDDIPLESGSFKNITSKGSGLKFKTTNQGLYDKDKNAISFQLFESGCRVTAFGCFIPYVFDSGNRISFKFLGLVLDDDIQEEVLDDGLQDFALSTPVRSKRVTTPPLTDPKKAKI